LISIDCIFKSVLLTLYFEDSHKRIDILYIKCLMKDINITPLVHAEFQRDLNQLIVLFFIK